jgi:uncharacterized protein
MIQNLAKAKKRPVLIFLLYIFVFFLLSGCSSSVNNEAVNFPSYSGYINDYSGKLDTESKNSLEELSAKIEVDTGSEIAVAIVNSIGGLSQEEYASGLFEEWGIGKEKEDNGILILIGIEGEAGKRPLKIEVGYGLEGVITDLEAGNIADNIIIPELQKGDFYTGLYNAIVAIGDQIYEEKGMGKISESSGTDVSQDISENIVIKPAIVEGFSFFSFVWIFCMGIPVIIVVSGILSYLFRRRCPKCKKFRLKIKKTVLKEATYTEKGLQLVERTCSNCGYYDRKEVPIPRKRRTSSYMGGGGGFGGSGSSGGGFGGFGGGSSGGGGAGRGW